jgi:hypothetical protein
LCGHCCLSAAAQISNELKKPAADLPDEHKGRLAMFRAAIANPYRVVHAEAVKQVENPI